MSWSILMNEPVAHLQFSAAVDDLEVPAYCEPPAIAQIQVAKRIAKEIAETIPGPYLLLSASGHANGVGWQGKEGWANDYVTVTVTQWTVLVTKNPPG